MTLTISELARAVGKSDNYLRQHTSAETTSPHKDTIAAFPSRLMRLMRQHVGRMTAVCPMARFLHTSGGAR